jgi:hypothetical protein
LAFFWFTSPKNFHCDLIFSIHRSMLTWFYSWNTWGNLMIKSSHSLSLDSLTVLKFFHMHSFISNRKSSFTASQHWCKWRIISSA